MGVSFSIPCDPCINKISHWLDERIACVHDLKKNVTSLVTTMEELQAKRDDWSRRIAREEDRGFQRLAEVQVWLTRVETIEKNLKSRYRYGRSIILTSRKVEKLKSQVFDVMVEQAQVCEVQELQIKPVIVGQETMLDKAWKQLKEDGVGIMGFCGMGGVGKTTLLTQINNKFGEERCGFDFVIWVVVSKDLQLDNIQDEVARKVGLGGEEWREKQKSQKTEEMYNFLRKKRFVLLLDDIWEKVDLTKIGIPIPTSENKCKVAFTTRSQEHMGVEAPMEVQCLSDNDAFHLFQKKVGQVTLGSDPEIPDLERIVARKCRGLPLALNVIGETMSCKRTIQEWHHAIDVLTSYAIEFSGMEDKILPLLKFRYDSLKEEKVKSCLLYCALLPEDYQILKETLIDYWICEVVLDLSHNGDLSELPNGISKLASLRYLNLSWTRIRAFTHGHGSAGSVEKSKPLGSEGNARALEHCWVEDLETLEHLEILTMGKVSSIFLSSRKLMSCTRSIEFRESRGLTNSRQAFEISLPVAMDKLRDFSIRECRVHEIKISSLVTTQSKNPTLHEPLPHIIHKEKASEGIVPFPKLGSLTLDRLWKLKNIYWNPLPLPYLQKIHVSECPNLKTLPLGSQSGKHGEDELIIRYTEQEWIDDVRPNKKRYWDIKAFTCCTRSFSFDTSGGAGTLHWGKYEWLSSASVLSKLEKQGRRLFFLWDGNTMVSPAELTSGAVWRYSSFSSIIQVLSQHFLSFQLEEDI
ncbi:hypothetical protein DY000_02012615 [Brassica cretica]|uniref:NB-ARC domain-containing protein n=1 Tax=Brassica cretica TaxID=69181 RepID=A0ABQ7D478_BRACR|nr:hypothetical protein DY000_02012615 [Brassica cretica]